MHGILCDGNFSTVICVCDTADNDNLRGRSLSEVNLSTSYLEIACFLALYVHFVLSLFRTHSVGFQVMPNHGMIDAHRCSPSSSNWIKKSSKGTNCIYTAPFS